LALFSAERLSRLLTPSASSRSLLIVSICAILVLCQPKSEPLKSCSFRSYFRGGGVRERERERERERGQRKSGEQASGGRKKKKRGRRSSGGCKRKQKADVVVVSELRPILRFETLFLRDEAPALTGPAPAQWRTEQNPCAKQLESGGRIVVATSRRCCSTTTKTATTARDAAFRIAPGAPSFATCEPPRDARNHLLRTCRVFCAMRMSKSARLDSATAVSISSLERPRKSAALVGLAASGATAEARRGAAEAKAAALLGEGARAAARMVLQERGEGRGRKCDEKRETRGREGVALTQDKKKKKTFLPVESPFFAPDTPSLGRRHNKKNERLSFRALLSRRGVGSRSRRPSSGLPPRPALPRRGVAGSESAFSGECKQQQCRRGEEKKDRWPPTSKRRACLPFLRQRNAPALSRRFFKTRSRDAS